MRTANEAPGPATLASPHSRLAWLPARQHCLEGSGPLRPWELGAGPLFYESLGLCVVVGTAWSTWHHTEEEVGKG